MNLKKIKDSLSNPFPFVLDLIEKRPHASDFGDALYTFETPAGYNYQVSLRLTNSETVLVEFETVEEGSIGVVNKGEMFKVMSTIVSIMKDYLSYIPQVNKLEFIPTNLNEQDEVEQSLGDKRAALYIRTLKQVFPDSQVEEKLNKYTISLVNK